MQIGDLVKHSGLNDVVWYGIITKEKNALKTAGSWPHKQYPITKYRVEWTFGDWGWFYPQDLEVV